MWSCPCAYKLHRPAAAIMPLTLLEVENLRPFQKITIVPDANLNLLIGCNASGKTSVLEAIHVLGTGRSFRTPQLDQLISHTTSSFLVSGLYHETHIPEVRLAVQRNQEKTHVHAGGDKSATASTLARILPLQMISPDSHFQFMSNARHRRGILDWGVFHVEPDFHYQWARFQRALQQRNASLKQRLAPAACFAWDPELLAAAEKLHHYRTQFLVAWNPRFKHYCQELLGSDQAEIEFKQGWDLQLGLAQVLRNDHARDIQKSTTHSGPQRADIGIVFLQQAARISASHGQQKLLIMALRLSQLELFTQMTTRPCLVLVDDLAAELDPLHRQQLMKVFARMSLQIFVTANEAGVIDIHSWPTHKVFHVEQGKVQEIKAE